MFALTNTWRLPALAFCGILCAVVVLAPAPNPALRSSIAIHNYGHVVVFGLVTVLLSFAFCRSSSPLLRQIRFTGTAAIAATLLGAAVELVQAATGASADLWDIVRDAGGASFAALAMIASHPALSLRASTVVGTIAAITLLAFTAPVLLALQDEARAHAQFPVLASFARKGELSRFRFDREARPKIIPIANSDGRAASGVQLHLPAGRYAGFGLIYFPRDWRSARALRLLIVNPEPTPVELTVRIDDAAHQSNLDFHDRFNRSFPIPPGPNKIEIPLHEILSAPRNRRFDLEHVYSLLVFAVDLPEPREILVGPIVLVP